MGGKASAASKNKYNAKAYDRINLTVPKGQKEEIQTYAEAHSESVNGFIGRAISEAMERENAVHVDAGGLSEAPRSAGMVPLGKVEAVKSHLELTGESEEAFVSRAIDARIQGDKTALKLGMNPATGKKMEYGT